MTNVPQELRDIWTDLYVFFDRHYKMRNVEADWKQYWTDAEELIKKHGRNKLLMDGIFCLITDYISEKMKQEWHEDLLKEWSFAEQQEAVGG